jgi:hypothetical protein
VKKDERTFESDGWERDHGLFDLFRQADPIADRDAFKAFLNGIVGHSHQSGLTVLLRQGANGEI